MRPSLERSIPWSEPPGCETVRLAIAARACMNEIAAREHIDFDLEQRGILHIYHERAAFEAAAAVNDLLREGGLERHPVTPAEMRDIEPALHGSHHGGFFTPSDEVLDLDVRAGTGRIRLFDSVFVDGAEPGRMRCYRFAAWFEGALACVRDAMGLEGKSTAREVQCASSSDIGHCLFEIGPVG